jgi:hypothetical protein
MIVVHVHIVDARINGRLNHAERGSVVGPNGVHKHIGTSDRRSQTITIGNIDRSPSHSGLMGNRRRSSFVPIQDTELDSCRVSQLVGDSATMKSAAKENDLLHVS